LGVVIRNIDAPGAEINKLGANCFKTMKFPTTGEDIKNEILISAHRPGDLRIRQLIHILPKVDPEIIVEGIIQVIEMEDRANPFWDQETAGKILETIKPKSQKDLKEILKRTLKQWNKSIEQLPFWLRDNYGLEIVTQTFDQMELDEIEADKLKTMKWWLGIKPVSA
jgi:hypothetical protein